MWLAKMIGRNSASEPILAAKTGDSRLIGDYEYGSIPFCAPYGIYSFPADGMDMAVFRMGEGDVCAGAVAPLPSTLKKGELLITNEGGAFIRLCGDGSISLNGVTITKEGILIQKGAK